MYEDDVSGSSAAASAAAAAAAPVEVPAPAAEPPQQQQQLQRHGSSGASWDYAGGPAEAAAAAAAGAGAAAEGGEGGEEEEGRVYCMCLLAHEQDTFISCDACGDWYHLRCAVLLCTAAVYCCYVLAAHVARLSCGAVHVKGADGSTCVTGVAC
jgi:hypothetical protein